MTLLGHILGFIIAVVTLICVIKFFRVALKLDLDAPICDVHITIGCDNKSDCDNADNTVKSDKD